MIKLVEKIPFWLSGAEIKLLADAAQAFWQRWEDWLSQVTGIVDITTCPEAALALHAWERGIARLPGEPVAVWRDRVLHAITTAIDSGSKRGLEFILGVYGVLGFQVLERVAGDDWDIIRIELDPVSLSADSELLGRVFTEWGRVCRRYIVGYTVPVPVYHGVDEYNRTMIVTTAA